jgi:hypothetical protein
MKTTMKTTMKTLTLAVGFTLGSLVGAANAAVISFDDAWNTLGQDSKPTSFYSTQGVGIFGTYHGLVGGVGNGDPGNWDLAGTVGSVFLGTNQGTSGNPTFVFSSAQTGTIDIGVPFGWTSTFQITGSLAGSSVFSSSININDNNNGQGTWSTFTFAAPVDTITVRLTAGSAFAYGIDNLNISAVPEPSSAILLGVGSLGLAAYRRRAK